ncbi:Hypothetical predicted protein [Cloeon dipterum]|uniref:Endonuclease/exonuclease/phosphatase domain-containing protein n=1 Tax=Cloeon dipterum TaxID=197152 RepID=A0A8S1E1D0_9INSE|nr:Hypothetical predicted protein [Cloeon dipterum]
MQIFALLMRPEIKNHEFVPREYVVLRKEQLGERNAAAGEVMLAIRPHLQPRMLQHLEGDAEVVWASVRAGRLLLLVGSAYRRPNADQEYNSALLRSLECAARQQHNYDGVPLMGDFNLDIKRDIEPPVVGVQPAEAFIDAFAEMSFAQFVKTATSTTNTSAMIIDLLLCDDPALVVEAHVVFGTSDHEAVVAKLAVSVQKPISAPTRVPNFQRANWPLLSQVLEQRLDCVSREECIITAWEMWKKILFDTVE